MTYLDSTSLLEKLVIGLSAHTIRVSAENGKQTEKKLRNIQRNKPLFACKRDTDYYRTVSRLGNWLFGINDWFETSLTL